MDIKNQLVSFTLDEQLLAIPISHVERVVRAVEVTPLKNAPASILGIIDYRGDIIPVLNLRKRLGFPERPVTASDRFLIIRTSSRRTAVVVDEIHRVISSDQVQLTTQGLSDMKLEAQGIARAEDGLIQIFDPEKFLSSTEEINLKKALKIK